MYKGGKQGYTGICKTQWRLYHGLGVYFSQWCSCQNCCVCVMTWLVTCLLAPTHLASITHLLLMTLFGCFIKMQQRLSLHWVMARETVQHVS